MRPLIQKGPTAHTPESLVEHLGAGPGVVLLRTSAFDSPSARYSIVTANPFLVFRSLGPRCEISEGPYPTLPIQDNPAAAEDTPSPGGEGRGEGGRTRFPQGLNILDQPAASPPSQPQIQFGNPWKILDALMSRCEVLDEIDLPFPLGGCFGYWGYDLKHFNEPKLPHRTVNDLELPDCQVGFYDSLVVFDHHLGRVTVVATGVCADGSRSEARARAALKFWLAALQTEPATSAAPARLTVPMEPGAVVSNLTRDEFLTAVDRARGYIRSGDIYQVNLSQRLTAPCPVSGWELFQRLAAVSPSPFAAYLHCGDFQIASSSPELFLRLSGSHILTRPIKGTRPRDPDPTRDAQLAYELQTSTKELAELVMITDLRAMTSAKSVNTARCKCPTWHGSNALPRCSIWFPRWKADCAGRSPISRRWPPASPAGASPARPNSAPWKSLMNWSPSRVVPTPAAMATWGLIAKAS